MSTTVLDNVRKNQKKLAVLLNALDLLASQGCKDSKEYEMINVLSYNLNFETTAKIANILNLENLYSR